MYEPSTGRRLPEPQRLRSARLLRRNKGLVVQSSRLPEDSALGRGHGGTVSGEKISTLTESTHPMRMPDECQSTFSERSWGKDAGGNAQPLAPTAIVRDVDRQRADAFAREDCDLLLQCVCERVDGLPIDGVVARGITVGRLIDAKGACRLFAEVHEPVLIELRDTKVSDPRAGAQRDDAGWKVPGHVVAESTE